MAHFRKILPIILILLVRPLFAAGMQKVLTGPESEFCQIKRSGNDDLSTYIDCLKDEESKVDKAMKAAFDRSLATVQSDDWLLPNVEYSDSNSDIVKQNKEAFIDNQKNWQKESAQFCELAMSRISASAPLYPVLLIQCRINMKKRRIEELNYFSVD
ncbi:lysozyme inhibitor LprI family protein [Pseudescherichia vulneris]|uniref:lysozyme inhibitor LprI family protein n=1 Tax=Pseudescherichia vulneris TaxID=566 RepID=UPI0028D2EEDD|nr:lysozyme inhibitor LprI family protein [Pseudescherichia vulneris]